MRFSKLIFTAAFLLILTSCDDASTPTAPGGGGGGNTAPKGSCKLLTMDQACGYINLKPDAGKPDTFQEYANACAHSVSDKDKVFYGEGECIVSEPRDVTKRTCIAYKKQCSDIDKHSEAHCKDTGKPSGLICSWNGVACVTNETRLKECASKTSETDCVALQQTTAQGLKKSYCAWTPPATK